MKKKTNLKKQKPPIASFAKTLADKLRAMCKGQVDDGVLGDGSARWVSVKVGVMKFELTFDSTGEDICYVELWEDVYEKVDEKLIFKV